MAILSNAQAKSFYDRFGSKQDSQAFYEDPATTDLIAHGRFDSANAVFEFGCGTGRFADKLLADHLPDSASYVAIDVSTTMVGLARDRLAKYGERAVVHLAEGDPTVSSEVASDATFDRFVSNYVLDLLSEKDIETVISEAGRLLAPRGLICLSGLGYGITLPSRTVSGTWKLIHSLSAKAVGGCRPVELLDFVQEKDWKIIHRKVVTPYCIPSEIVVAEKQRV